jgi:hypothetical protein
MDNFSQKNTKNKIPPHRLTGGVQNTLNPTKEMIELPENLTFSVIPDGYAKLLAQNFDYLQEAYNLKLKSKWEKEFEKLKEEAKELDESAKTGLSFYIDNFEFQILGKGASGGFRYFIKSDEFIIMIGSSKKEWSISVRYLATGLWQSGIYNLKAKLLQILGIICNPPATNDYIRLSRVDYAFDLYSPSFTSEMTPDICKSIVARSKVKFNIHTSCDVSGYGAGGLLETVNIGSIKSLQVGIYNKTKEINHKFDNKWFQEIWASQFDGEILEKDVWRVECRFAKDFLRRRGVLTFEDFDKFREELITEALTSRRLTNPETEDNNRARWALHPLFVIAHDNAGTDCTLPIGKRIVETKSKLKDRANKQIAGSLRSLSVLKKGEYDNDVVIASMVEIMSIIETDEYHSRKERKAQEKYKKVA